MIRFDNEFIYLETPNTLLVFEIKDYIYDDPSFNEEGNKLITQRYYGPKSRYKEIKPEESKMNPFGACYDYDSNNLIYSYFGNGNNSDTSLLILNSDNSFTNRFYFREAKVIKGGVDIVGPHARNIKETLDIVEVDESSAIELHHYYSLCDDNDVITVKVKIINKGDKEFFLRKIASLETPIESKSLKIYTYYGKWLEERIRHESTLNSGIFVNASFAGTSSHKHNPFINVIDLENNLYYAFNLIYSGNHKETVEVNPVGHSSIMIGINDYAFDYRLKGNDSFVSPEAIMVVSTSLDETRTNMHKFVNSHIINPSFQYKKRPILFNSWEGSTFDINEESLFEMAKLCKDIGVELFVIDDGWFKNRNDDYHALGDWTPDKNKFTNGLGEISKRIKSLGLKFGIWIEPEMISRNSEIFKNHPEYALMSKNRHPIERRHQLVIDMTNKEVRDYLFNSLSKVFEEAEVDYVKWDFNRFLIDVYSSTPIRAGEYFHNFIHGTYDLYERLTKRFPNVLFEGCSSGGGRFDLGMLYYSPQIWTSDNSVAYSRSFITSGTLEGYPQSTMGAHVSKDTNGCDRTSTLEDRFNINCIGGFGYEFDLREFDDNTLQLFKKHNEFFKKHQYLIQFGSLMIIDNPFDDNRFYSFIINNNDEAILFVSELIKGNHNKKWRCKGIDSEANYEIVFRDQNNAPHVEPIVMSGKELINQGIDIGSISLNEDVEEGYQGIYSRIAVLRKIKN
ncbi:MAG: alpha-galactosidase [Bacilli bacterium]|nr:alpha-galactosidase [Bacilli bacterium]